MQRTNFAVKARFMLSLILTILTSSHATATDPGQNETQVHCPAGEIGEEDDTFAGKIHLIPEESLSTIQPHTVETDHTPSV